MRTTRTSTDAIAARAAARFLSWVVPCLVLLAGGVSHAPAFAQTAPADSPARVGNQAASRAVTPAASGKADPGLGWLGGLAGNCWRPRPVVEGLAEMCFVLEDEGRVLRVESRSAGADPKPVSATTFQVAQSQGIGYLSARSVDVASGREESYSVGFEWNNPKGPLTRTKYDQPERMSSSGYSRTTWRPLDRDRFEIESFYQYGGGAQGFRRNKWIFSRGRKAP